jgi:hypothetical protein
MDRLRSRLFSAHLAAAATWQGLHCALGAPRHSGKSKIGFTSPHFEHRLLVANVDDLSAVLNAVMPPFSY